MTRAWKTLATASTSEGTLELRRRDDSDWLLVIGGRVLMSSTAGRSEEALATRAIDRLAGRPTPRILIGGLGMGITLRAALDAAPPDARITVVELNAAVVDWCRGPLAPLTGGAALDPRVVIETRDVAEWLVHAAADSLDAILLDLYEGPNAATQRDDDPFFGTRALAHMHSILRSRSVLAIWSEDADPPFSRRLAAAGFDVSVHREGRGGRRHLVYLGTRR